MNDADRSSIAFLRKDPADESYLVCVCNFTPSRYDDFVIGLPPRGTLQEILNSDEERFGGKGVRNEALIRSDKEGFWELPCSAKLTLPAMSTLYFRYHTEKAQQKTDTGLRNESREESTENEKGISRFADRNKG